MIRTLSSDLRYLGTATMQKYSSKEQFLSVLDNHTLSMLPLCDHRMAPFNAYHIIFMEPQVIEGIWSTMDFEISTDCLDWFCYAYAIWQDNKAASLWNLFFGAMELDKLPSWRSYVGEREEKYEMGQAKIFFSSLPSFVALKKSNIKVLVIGSASESTVSGVSYTALPEILSDMGYHGEFVLFDTLEVPGESVIRNFTVKRYNRLFDFEHDHLLYDVILDDSFIEEGFVSYGYCVNPKTTYNFLDKQGKFLVMKINGNDVILGRNVSRHKELAIGEPLGGGSYVRVGDKIIITSNESRTYGAVNIDSLIAIGFTVERNSWKYVKSRLLKHETARVNFKWPYLDDSEVGYLIDQYCYKNKERRLLINTPVASPVKTVYLSSDGCRLCNHVGSMIENIIHYSTVSNNFLFDKCYHLLGRSCKPLKGIKRNSIWMYLKNAATREKPLEKVLIEIGTLLNVPEETVRKYYESAIAEGIIFKKVKNNVIFLCTQASQEEPEYPWYVRDFRANFPKSLKIQLRPILGWFNSRSTQITYYHSQDDIKGLERFVFMLNNATVTSRMKNRDDYELLGMFKGYLFYRKKMGKY